jgi:hypothetical protein
MLRRMKKSVAEMKDKTVQVCQLEECEVRKHELISQQSGLST